MYIGRGKSLVRFKIIRNKGENVVLTLILITLFFNLTLHFREIRLDIHVLNHEGNVADCAGVAGLAALAHFKRPDVTLEGDVVTVRLYNKMWQHLIKSVNSRGGAFPLLY